MNRIELICKFLSVTILILVDGFLQFGFNDILTKEEIKSQSLF